MIAPAAHEHGAPGFVKDIAEYRRAAGKVVEVHRHYSNVHGLLQMVKVIIPNYVSPHRVIPAKIKCADIIAFLGDMMNFIVLQKHFIAPIHYTGIR